MAPSGKDKPNKPNAAEFPGGRALVSVMVVVVLALVSFALAYFAARTWSGPPEQDAVSIAVAQTDGALVDEAAEPPSETSGQNLPPLDVVVPETAEGLLDEASRVADDLVARYPQNPDAFETTARFHLRMGNKDEAEKAWQTSLKLDPQYAHAMEGLATIASQRGEHQKAVSLLRQALLIRPTAPEVQVELAKALLAQGKAEESVEILEKTVETHPGSLEAFTQYGAALLQLKQYEEAKEAYEKAVELDPAHGPAYIGLATASARLGQTEEAKRYQQKVQETQAERTTALREERQAYEDLAALRDDTARSYSEMGRVYLAIGELESAKYLWHRAAYLDEKNVEARQALAWLYAREGQLLKTIRVMFQLAKIEPDNMSYSLESARLFLELGQPQDAEWVLQRQADGGPGRDPVHAALAEMYLNILPNPAKALEHAQRAVELAPSADNFVLLSSAYEATGDQQAAIEAMGKAVDQEPGNLQYKQVYELMKESDAEARTPAANE